MKKPVIAFAMALIASPALPDTLISNVNGIDVDANGKLQHFGSLLIGDDGRVKQVMTPPSPRLAKVEKVINGGGKTLLPGMVDSHNHLSGVGQRRVHHVHDLLVASGFEQRPA